mgnify:CR=1 FL=1
MIPRIDSRVYILLKSIDSRLYRQNEDMKKAIDQLVCLNSALVELQNEIKVCASCMSAMLDALNELKSKNSQQAEPEATPTKYRARILQTGERLFVVLRSTVTSSLRTTCAEQRPVWTALRCIWPAPQARRSSSKAALLRSPASNSSAGTLSATALRLRSLTCKNPRKPIGFFQKPLGFQKREGGGLWWTISKWPARKGC